MIRSTIYWVENTAPGRLGILARPRAGDWLEDEMKALREAGVDILVSLLTAEEVAELELTAEQSHCEATGMAFISFPINDRSTPDSDSEALALVHQLKRAVVDGKSVAIHCRMGIGRSSMVAAGMLVMLGMEGERAFELLAASRRLPVPDTEQQRKWVLGLTR
jgi:protein-tyrosine phosphatase